MAQVILNFDTFQILGYVPIPHLTFFVIVNKKFCTVHFYENATNRQPV